MPSGGSPVDRDLQGSPSDFAASFSLVTRCPNRLPRRHSAPAPRWLLLCLRPLVLLLLCPTPGWLPLALLTPKDLGLRAPRTLRHRWPPLWTRCSPLLPSSSALRSTPPLVLPSPPPFARQMPSPPSQPLSPPIRTSLLRPPQLGLPLGATLPRPRLRRMSSARPSLSGHRGGRRGGQRSHCYG